MRTAAILAGIIALASAAPTAATTAAKALPATDVVDRQEDDVFPPDWFWEGDWIPDWVLEGDWYVDDMHVFARPSLTVYNSRPVDCDIVKNTLLCSIDKDAAQILGDDYLPDWFLEGDWVPDWILENDWYVDNMHVFARPFLTVYTSRGLYCDIVGYTLVCSTDESAAQMHARSMPGEPLPYTSAHPGYISSTSHTSIPSEYSPYTSTSAE
jgi:hypothetical protein